MCYRLLLYVGHVQGQRPGVMGNMTLAEFESGKWETGDLNFFVTVAQHKTSATGTAIVKLDTVEHELFERYCGLYWPRIKI